MNADALCKFITNRTNLSTFFIFFCQAMSQKTNQVIEGKTTKLTQTKQN